MKRVDGTATPAVNSLTCLEKPLSECEFGGPGGLGLNLGTSGLAQQEFA